MDLLAVATQVGAALGPVTPTLRVYPYGATKVEAPAAVFALPTSINYHEGGGLGASSIRDATVLVLLRDNVRRSSFAALAGYVKPSGAGSVKAALEQYAATAWDALTVTSVDFDVVSMAGEDYLAALFHLDLFGTGA